MAFTDLDVFYASNDPKKFADKLNASGIDPTNADAITALATVVAGKAKVVVVDGVAEGAVALGDTPVAVIAVFAIVKASGAVATKFLLDATTDYTVATSNLTCVTDQSLNKLVVIYK
jgi:hypothetical protein